jgi:hypothetical protein
MLISRKGKNTDGVNANQLPAKPTIIKLYNFKLLAPTMYKESRKRAEMIAHINSQMVDWVEQTEGAADMKVGRVDLRLFFP